MSVWKRFKRWLITLLSDDAPAYDLHDADLAALRDIAFGPPAQGWFVWECEQYAKYPAFWFDHWRYDDSPFAYPDPAEHERRTVYVASANRAIETYGEVRVRQHADALFEVIKGTPRQKEFNHQPDPIVWAMGQSVH